MGNDGDDDHPLCDVPQASTSAAPAILSSTVGGIGGLRQCSGYLTYEESAYLKLTISDCLHDSRFIGNE
jgi:hypothetical protein